MIDSSGAPGLGAEDGRLVLARGDDLDVLLRLTGDGLVVLLQQVVERTAQRQVEQPGEPLGG